MRIVGWALAAAAVVAAVLLRAGRDRRQREAEVWAEATDSL